MSVMVIMRSTVIDRDGMEPYVQALGEQVVQYGGEVLAVDGEVETLEGRPDVSRAAVVSFPDRETANRWFQSDEHQQARARRRLASITDTVVVKAG